MKGLGAIESGISTFQEMRSFLYFFVLAGN
jgi:hypothetical protein